MIETLQSLLQGFLDWLAPVIHPDTGQIVTGPTPDVGGLVNLPLLGLGLAVVLVGIVGWYLDARREWRRAEDPTWSAAPALEPGPEPTPPPGVHLPGPSPWPFLAPIALAVFMFGIVFSFWFVLGGLAMAVVAIAGWYRDAGREWRGAEEGCAPPHYEARSAISGRLVSLYALIAAVSLGLFFAPNYIAWVNPVPTLAPAASLSANLKITAVSVLGFDTQSLTVPADTPLTVEFDNPDAGVQHNFAIYTSSDLATALFEGERITGPAKATYQVPPIPEGTYHFVCDVALAAPAPPAGPGAPRPRAAGGPPLRHGEPRRERRRGHRDRRPSAPGQAGPGPRPARPRRAPGTAPPPPLGGRPGRALWRARA